jgi:hypothetical protein
MNKLHIRYQTIQKKSPSRQIFENTISEIESNLSFQRILLEHINKYGSKEIPLLWYEDTEGQNMVTQYISKPSFEITYCSNKPINNITSSEIFEEFERIGTISHFISIGYLENWILYHSVVPTKVHGITHNQCRLVLVPPPKKTSFSDILFRRRKYIKY